MLYVIKSLRLDLQNVYNGCVNTTIVLLDDNYSPDQGNGANGDSNYGTNGTISAEGDSCKRRE